MKWFKHDSDASNDAKLRKLRHKYGSQGYGVYWYCLELVARNVDKHNLTFELEHDAELIADDFKLSTELVEEMMLYMVKVGLFENSRGIITCLKMSTRTDEYTQKLLAKSSSSPDSVPTISGQTPTKSELIEEKRREEINNAQTPDGEKSKTAFKKPSVEEIADYCEERNNGLNPETIFDHYQANGWMRGKTKIKDWKACVRTWEKNNPKSGVPDYYADQYAGCL